MGQNIRVLHVDDEPAFADMTATFLQRENEQFEVTTVTSAGQGLNNLTEQPFDCVVSDYDMPGKKGIEFLRAVREDHGELPFILFTGKGSEEVASDAISAGVTDYLQKKSGTDQYTVLANRIQNAVDRQRAERARQRNREAIETAKEGISILSEDGQYLYVNEAFADLYGYEPDEMIGEQWQLVYPDTGEVERVNQEILPEVKREGNWHGTTTGLRADGSTFIEDHRLAMTDHGELVCTVREMGEHERALREEQLFVEQALDALDDVFYVLGTDGHLHRWNDRLTAITGYSDDEIDGRHATELVPEDDQNRIVTAIEETLTTGSTVVEAELLTPDDGPIPYEFTVSRLTDSDGDVIGLIGVGRDVAERIEREAQLRDNTARLEALFEESPDLINIHDTDGNIIDPNPQLSERTGYDVSVLREMNVWELDQTITPEEARTFWESIDTGERRRVEGQYRCADGSSFPVEIHLRRLDLEGADRFIAIARDITDQKDRERRLEQSEMVFEYAQDAMFLIDVSDSEFTIRRVNPAYERETGLSAEQLVEKTPQDVLDAETGAAVENRYRACVDRREPLTYEEQLPIDGEITTWDTRIAPVIVDGRVSQLVGATRNITGRKERERQLQQYKEIVETTDDITLVVDDSRVVDFVNESITEYIDMPVENIEGQPVGDLVEQYVTERDEPSRFADALERVFAAEPGSIDPERLELTHRSDGRTHTFECQISPLIVDGETTAAVVTMRDISERTQRERRLERQNERFDELASAVSHDLQTPISTVKGRLELALQTGEMNHVEKAAEAIDRVDQLRTDLVTTLRTGEIVAETERTGLEPVTDDAWATIDPPQPTSITVEESGQIEADRDAFRRLLENLIHNSIEHGSGDVKIRLGALESGFYYEDNGTGIDPEHRDEVFTPGFSTKDGSEGIGMGMASVRQIVLAHDWCISIDDAQFLDGVRFEITE